MKGELETEQGKYYALYQTHKLEKQVLESKVKALNELFTLKQKEL